MNLNYKSTEVQDLPWSPLKHQHTSIQSWKTSQGHETGSLLNHQTPNEKTRLMR